MSHKTVNISVQIQTHWENRRIFAPCVLNYKKENGFFTCSNLHFPISEAIPLTLLSQSLKHENGKEVASVDTQEHLKLLLFPEKNLGWSLTSNATFLTFFLVGQDARKITILQRNPSISLSSEGR